jgi:hypothetical protein
MRNFIAWIESGGWGDFNNTDIPHQECKGRHEKLYLKHIVTSRNDMLGANIETTFTGSQWVKLDNETVRAISTTGRGEDMIKGTHEGENRKLHTCSLKRINDLAMEGS